MQQVWNKLAAVMLCVVLATVSGCSGQAYTPEYTRVEYDPGRRFGSTISNNLPNPTNFVDGLTQQTNYDLATGEWLADLPLVQLDFEGNEISPIRYSYSLGDISTFSVDDQLGVRLHSTIGQVTFVVYNFNHLLPSQFVSYVEVIGDADFYDWRGEGFYYGIRQGGSQRFSWSGPAGGNRNWIFSHSLHESANYQGGIPSVVIAVANGDTLRIREIRVVVSNVDDHLRRSGVLDPHRVWPFLSNQYYNPTQVSHFYNGTYHRDNPNETYRDYDYQPYRTNGYWDNGFWYSRDGSYWDYESSFYRDSNLDSVYDRLYNTKNQVIELQDQIDELNSRIEEISGPAPIPSPVPIPVPVPEPTPVAPLPVLKTVPVL